ncbi:unnamed protein product [Hydatigera taeniaeformis]|uniref:MARVEL domain-containing protein n=1 Tax=Hydatigena taeniaeformis TaxID=6205 RepID=A0A0R3WS91_HYDTA|nr:unnamed protein product [Hydatigera taeniaeformis]
MDPITRDLPYSVSLSLSTLPYQVKRSGAMMVIKLGRMHRCPLSSDTLLWLSGVRNASAVALDINICGSLLTKSCQRDEAYKQMAALLATALVLFIISTIFAFISIFNKKCWVCISEFITAVAGGTLLLTALCIYYQGKQFWAPLVAGIAMTSGMQTSVFMLIDMIA